VPAHAFTIAKLADAAGVGVETVRYYQRRGLIDEAQRVGGFRAYAASDVQRLQFIRRAQDLGFSLDDIAELLSLSAHPNKSRVREITQRRLADVRERIEQLGAMAAALEGMVDCCVLSAGETCPIIAALSEGPESESCCSAAAPKPAPRARVGRVRASRGTHA
jgi:MerR family mercuric resistance operon transcriptional regulator